MSDGATLGETPTFSVTGTSEPEYLTEDEAAEFLRGVTPRTLARWRVEGKGPRYRRHGIEALYTRADLRVWSDAHAFTSTAEEKVARRAA